MEECREIQKRLAVKLQKKEDSKEKAFLRLMLMGKVGAAMKHINNEDQTLGVHPLNEDIKKILRNILKVKMLQQTYCFLILPQSQIPSFMKK